MMVEKENLKVHFSIDDVIKTLHWAYRNEPTSIFDMEFFATLREWHEKYGVKVTLYMFFSDGDGFDIAMLQERYVNELKNNNDWLKTAYHGIYSEKYIEDANKFESEMLEFNKVWGRKMLSQTVRLHGWQSPISINELRGFSGVAQLLCPYEIRTHVYDLTKKEIDMVLKEGLIQKNGVVYRKTDVVCDFCENVNEVKKQITTEDNGVYVFMHEWRFGQQKRVIEEFLQGVDEFEY